MPWHINKKQINKKNMLLYFSQAQVLIYFMKINYFIWSVSNKKRAKQ